MPFDGRRINCEIAEAFLPELFEPHRYKVYFGGRGGAKSVSAARALVIKAFERKLLILCARQYQTNIRDSVYSTLVGEIAAIGLADDFQVLQNEIRCSRTGSVFIFKGLYNNVHEIKSLYGVDICWVEEAHSVSEESWKVLIPTIRKDQSEIWVTFNPVDEQDPTYQRFIIHGDSLEQEQSAVIKKVGWQDNPWLPEALENERRYLLKVDPDAYEHVWEGHTRAVSEATILRGKYVVERFEPPEATRFHYGADWGFAKDPTVLIRCYINGTHLYIDHEAYGVGVELDGAEDGRDVANLFDLVPGSRDHRIYADDARPETIAFMRRRGFAVEAVEKWKGSVEDGIAHLRAFEKIHIHERCVHTAQEARLYRYKLNPRTQEIVLPPKAEDLNNHCVDSCRYALNEFITRRGDVGIWAKLVS